ncbi:agamous-like MADS-box protein AGL80 [Salvia divinorum]|uniref:Agamous-like MADS-box protein AGL80 n=1 Tax=Salvia divinorum TaxID=28513 RepID=A0ABD1GX06_SALDI
MPRQKTKHTQILSERVRKSTFKRRLDSLFKKAHELSVLCGVEIVIIVHNPKESHSTLWPSYDQVMNGVMKFVARSKEPGPKKMVLHEKFLSDKLKSMTDRLLKLQKKNDETEMGFLMTQLLEGGIFNVLDMRQLNGLDQFVEEKMKKLENRYNELAGAQDQLLCTNNLHHIQMTPAMAENRITTSFTDWNQGGVPDEFGSVWPTNFYP